MSTNVIPAVSINELIDDIVAYLKLLNERYTVTVHGVDRVLGPYLSHFLPFNLHIMPLCMHVKSRANTMAMCVRCQRCTIAYAGKCGDHFGTCYFGMSEYVFTIPLNVERSRFGIVSVSGYRADPATIRSRVEHASKHTWLDKGTLMSFIENTNADVPPLAEVRAQVRPLVHMMSLLAQTVERLNLSALPAESMRDAFYHKIIRYLEFNYRSNLTMQELAKANHCSVSFLSHMFKTKSGLSLRAYINALRIRDAAVYLVNTDIPVSEIAYLLGYEDSNYFSTVFLREKGCPPSAYRKQYSGHGK